MREIETGVSAHYSTDDLLQRIGSAVAEAGGDPDALKPEDLKGVDEFHTGGLEATDHLLNQLDFDASTRVLDVGCGIGGTARHIALATGGQVTGVDLTPDYVQVARDLSAAVGLGDRVSFHVGSALDLPLDDAAFDLVTMFHVGMNIADKRTLMAEIARVLAPGGTFAMFDIMRFAEGDLTFPFPWAERAELSFVDPPEVYRDAAERAGLELGSETMRAEFALEFFRKAFAAIEQRGGPPPVGIHLLMRETAREKLKNYVTAVEAGRIAPVEMIFRKPA